ncbi:SseB family protein [Cellulomonas sp. ACRRI]|uniref:SseB family protein n=1 Tax=Cellulomonas sp. ACRRI TaxID=2918188 RepID=UPI001EF1EEFE|nr:SseB family protein [Cellulomonas sp. ACRRI]MCG7285534.1 SseB family protein [Cellulomonas sp. ACRRI]
MTGRELPPTSAFAGDDGSADPRVAAALAALGDGTGTLAGVVEALAGTRVLVPVLAELEAAETVEVGGHAHTVDKEASAGIVALQAPDGRTALPVFSSVAAMAAWRRDARPVPTDVVRAALSAVSEGWELLVLDAGGPDTALLPRPAVWALAQQQSWRPAVLPGSDGAAVPSVDPEVREAIRAAVLGAVPADAGPGAAASGGAGTSGGGSGSAGRSWFRRRRAEPAAAPTPGTPGPVVDVDALPGSRAEVAVVLTLVPGLDRPTLDGVLRRVGEALAADDTVTRRVDSVEVRLR